MSSASYNSLSFEGFILKGLTLKGGLVPAFGGLTINREGLVRICSHE